VIAWAERSADTRALLNPPYCALLLWRGARGYARESSPFPIETAFLVLPLVLSNYARGLLPRTVATSLPAWLDSNPLARSYVADRAHTLLRFTKEALLFAGAYGLITFEHTSLEPNPAWRQRIDSLLPTTTHEVQESARRAEFVGRWFARTGDAATLLALFGLRP